MSALRWLAIAILAYRVIDSGRFVLAGLAHRLGEPGWLGVDPVLTASLTEVGLATTVSRVIVLLAYLAGIILALRAPGRAAVLVGGAFVVDAIRVLIISAQAGNTATHISIGGDQADLLFLIGWAKVALGGVAAGLLYLAARRRAAPPA